MSDKLVFDLSQEVEGTPNVFVRKDWINILDNQNSNYNSNQSVIDTSQLSNSNKYMSYREAYLAVPMLLTIGSGVGDQKFVSTDGTMTWAAHANVEFCPFAGNTGGSTGHDGVMGLKNWFGSIVHSLTLDYNGTTICQQTPYINMWNSFKLMTSLSLNDVSTQGCKIGFFPDDAKTFQFFPSAAGSGVSVVPSVAAGDFIMPGTCNNSTLIKLSPPTPSVSSLQSYSAGLGNVGYVERIGYINYDDDALVTNVYNTTTAGGGTTASYGSLVYTNATNLLWKSHVVKKQTGRLSISTAVGGAIPTLTNLTPAVFQIAVTAVIYLKHLHSFFNMVPLLKGVFMKLTLNLNNTSSSLVQSIYSAATGNVAAGLQVSSVSNAIGGVNPLMVSSPVIEDAATQKENGGFVLARIASDAVTATGTGSYNITYTANVSVGNRCLDSKLVAMSGITTGNMAQSIYLYVPAYTFNPEFEQAYLSTPVKQIKYTDVYQYQINSIAAGQSMNSLVTNGIANIKSILILPFYSSSSANATNIQNIRSGVLLSPNSGIAAGVPVYQSPFDPAGTGCTSPLCHITNFNIQISGQNAIYNMQKYNFEQFNDQLYGQNAVNGGLTDGLTSSLIGRQEFDMEYCYYYINVERMLPVEMAVPKSVQILGQNMSSKSCDYFVFVEYGVEFPVDALTGARV